MYSLSHFSALLGTLFCITGNFTFAHSYGQVLLMFLSPVALLIGFERSAIRKRPVSFSTCNKLAAVCFFAVAADFFLSARGLIDSIGRFLILTSIILSFSEKTQRVLKNWYPVNIILFFSSADMATDLVFAPLLAAFLITGTGAALLMQFPEEFLQEQRIGRNMPWITGTSGMMGLCVLAAGTAGFLCVPRVDLGIMQRWRQYVNISGFDLSVSLTDIGRIKQSNIEVMRVFSDKPAYWRGRSFAEYTGHGWKAGHTKREDKDKVYLRDGVFIISERAAMPSETITQHFVLSNYNEIVVFAAYRPVELVFPAETIVVDAQDSIYSRRPLYRGVSYDVVSEKITPDEKTLLAPDGQYPQDIEETYLQLPEISPRVTSLTGEITAGKTNAYGKAAAIRDYLEQTYGYSLNPGNPGWTEPVEYFLFERRAGHCEYFATAMAVMCRISGVPARYVNGFMTGEFDTVTQSFVVRQKDAHSWVEVYFPGPGWISFDPTPGSPDVRLPSLGALQKILAHLRYRWNRYVVQFSPLDQQLMASRLISSLRHALSSTGSLLSRTAGHFLSSGKNSAALLAVTVLALAAVFVIVKSGFTRRASAGKQQAALTPAQKYARQAYFKMLKVMSKKGFSIAPGMTPMEFAAAVESKGCAAWENVLTTVRVFYSLRFGNSPLTSQVKSQTASALKNLLQ